jgi:hypothetical protein
VSGVNNSSVEKRTAAPIHKTPVLSFCVKEKKAMLLLLCFFELPEKQKELLEFWNSMPNAYIAVDKRLIVKQKLPEMGLHYFSYIWVVICEAHTVNDFNMKINLNQSINQSQSRQSVSWFNNNQATDSYIQNSNLKLSEQQEI